LVYSFFTTVPSTIVTVHSGNVTVHSGKSPLVTVHSGKSNRVVTVHSGKSNRVVTAVSGSSCILYVASAGVGCDPFVVFDDPVDTSGSFEWTRVANNPAFFNQVFEGGGYVIGALTFGSVETGERFSGIADCVAFDGQARKQVVNTVLGGVHVPI
jgi:hypothetical protein